MQRKKGLDGFLLGEAMRRPQSIRRAWDQGTKSHPTWGLR